jgi:hypothetical protein
MKDNLIFKILRRFRRSHLQRVIHYSDGVIITGEDNPTPLTRKTEIIDIYRQERSPKK